MDAASGKPELAADLAAKAASPGNASPQQAPPAAVTPGDAAAPAASLITAHLQTSGPNDASTAAQTATNTVKAATANLPTFGILTANAATT